MTTHHFAASGWYRSLEEHALNYLADRIIYPAEFLEKPLIRSVRCCVRPMTDDEIASLGVYPTIAQFSMIEFVADELFEDHISELPDPEDDRISRDELIELWLDVELSEFATVYLFVVSLSTFGAFEPHQASSPLVSGTTGHRFVGLRLYGDLSNFWKAPPTCGLDIDAILRWSRECGGLWKGKARTNIEKGVCFLSYALHADEAKSSVSRLLWSIAALEAIAAQSSAGVRNSLTRRIPPLVKKLGLKNATKLIGAIYDFRSRVFHGDVALHNPISDPDGFEVKGPEGRMHEFGLISSLMVLAIIWECVERGAYEIRFDESPTFA